jgi:hypothetical protein
MMELLSRIQIIDRHPHAATSLDGRVGFEDEAIRQLSRLPYHGKLPSTQAVSVQSQNRSQPIRGLV